MSKSVSALNGKAHVGTVSIAEQGLRGMITLRGDLNSPELQKAAIEVSGQTCPKQGQCSVAGDKGLAWMSPDEMLVMVPYDDVADTIATLEAALKGSHFLAIDVSDARAVIRVEGAGVRDVLAKLSPVDMSAEAFKPGQFRRTRLAQIPAAFWMHDDETLDLICFRSVADYAFDVLCRAALPGTEVGYIAT